MTNSQKGILAVVVLVLILIGAYYLFASHPAAYQTSGSTQNALGSTSEDTTLPSGSDTSDAAMQEDLNSVDAQMGGFASDSTSVNQGIDSQSSGGTQ